MIESGNSTLTEKNIKLICVIFDVNESWFRTGIGEIFSSEIEGENELLKIFRGLLPETREMLLNIRKELIKTQVKLLPKEIKISPKTESPELTQDKPPEKAAPSSESEPEPDFTGKKHA
jgi:hypothetical protein